MQGGITQDYSLAAGLEQVMPSSRAPRRWPGLHASDGKQSWYDCLQALVKKMTAEEPK